MPIASLATLATGARQLVVHDALDTTWWLSLSYWSKLTPRTTVASGSVAGAEMMTFLAPPSMCLAASARLVKKPVDSITTSTFRSPHGRLAGSRSASTLTSLPLTISAPSPTSTVPGNLPNTESYLSRWPSVPASVMSLTATISTSAPCACAARKTLRPIRPKPLIPTRTAMVPTLSGFRERLLRLPNGVGEPGLHDQHHLPGEAAGLGEAQRLGGLFESEARGDLRRDRPLSTLLQHVTLVGA